MRNDSLVISIYSVKNNFINQVHKICYKIHAIFMCKYYEFGVLITFYDNNNINNGLITMFLLF